VVRRGVEYWNSGMMGIQEQNRKSHA